MSKEEEGYRAALQRIRPEAEARAKREERVEQETREREEAIKEEHRRVSAELYPLISKWLNELSTPINQDLTAIGELIVLDEYASYVDGFLAGSTVYFVPRETLTYEAVEKRYQFGQNWSEYARRKQVEFTRSTARLRVLVVRDKKILFYSEVARTEEEDEKYWLEDSPRHKEQVTVYLPSEEFSYDRLKSSFVDS